MYPKVTIKSGREAPVRAGHPWVFSGAVDQIETGIANGDLVTVVDARGRCLGHGYYNGHSSIRVRILSRDKDEAIGAEFWQSRIARALDLRHRLFGAEGSADIQTNAYRLVNGEGDLLPGLVIDRYAECLVVQFHTLGMDRRREEILRALDTVPGVKAIVERSDLAVRKKEGMSPLPPRMLRGDALSANIQVKESGTIFRADLLSGQKTGLYLDQRDNRRRVALFARGMRVLNCYAYTGGFSLAALRGGAAQVTSVERSAPALAMLEANFELNGLAEAPHRVVAGEVTGFLDTAFAQREQYDIVVLDPPAFVKHRSALRSGMAAYRRLNRQALRLLPPGGILVSTSCSNHVSAEDWQGVLYEAVRSEGRTAQLLAETFHPPDHPTHLQCREGRYLKCLFLRLWD